MAASPAARQTAFSFGALAGFSYDPCSGFSPPAQDQSFYSRRPASDSSRNTAPGDMTPVRQNSARQGEPRELEQIRASEPYSSEQCVSPQLIVPSQAARRPPDHGAQVSQSANSSMVHDPTVSQRSETSRDNATRVSQRLTLDEDNSGSIDAAQSQKPPPDITESYERTVISISSESEDQLSSSLDSGSDSDSDSDMPLNVFRRPGQAFVTTRSDELLHQSSHDRERQESNLQAERPASTPAPEDPLPISAKSPQSPDPGPLIIEHRFQRDVNWDKKCDRCRDEGFRCYTAQNTTSWAKSCFLCYQDHKICAIDGVRTHKGRSANVHPSQKKPKQATAAKSPPKQNQRTSARLSKRKSDASSSQAATRHASPKLPRTRSQKRLKQERRGRPRRHTLPPAAGIASEEDEEEDSDANDTQPKARKRRRNGTFRPLAESEDELADDPPLQPTGSDDQPSSKDQQLREKRAPLCNSGVSNTDPTVSEPAGADRAVNVHGKSAEKLASERGLGPFERQRLEKYASMLFKDISTAVGRCRERVAEMSDDAGLLALESTLEVLVSDLAKLTAVDHQANEAAQVYWFVPQVTEYLQRIRLECQLVQERQEPPAAGPGWTGKELKARHVASALACETLFDRCLSLISMHENEK